MRHIILSLILFTSLNAPPLSALDFVTAKGLRYLDAVLVDEDDNNIKLRHANGFAKISKSEVTPSMAAAFGIKLTNVTTPETGKSGPDLQSIIAKFPEIETKDGRKFSSKDLREIEPNGLKFFTASGITKVRFLDLKPSYLEAFSFDRDKADAFEKNKLRRKLPRNETKLSLCKSQQSSMRQSFRQN